MKINVELLEPFDWEDKHFVLEAEVETLADLVDILFAEEHADLRKLVVKNQKVNPAMLVLVNGVSTWDLDHKLAEGDELVFSRTISGG